MLCHHFCALWHSLISYSDKCETSFVIQTNALILSIFNGLIFSLFVTNFFLILSLACLWQHGLGIYIRFLSCTRKIKPLTVTSLKIQVWFHSVSWFHLAITHGWPSFQTALLYQITPEPKESCSFTGCFRIRAIWSHKALAWYNVRSHFLGNKITVKSDHLGFYSRTCTVTI